MFNVIGWVAGEARAKMKCLSRINRRIVRLVCLSSRRSHPRSDALHGEA